jgi:2-phospho-L-lactate guanylyltransferase
MQVLLPLKEFAASKQRLAGVLSATERACLLQSMVGDVLAVLTQHRDIERIAICSRDRAAQWLANCYDVEFIDEQRTHTADLNAAVNAAVNGLADAGCSDILVVHGDLPLLSAQDLSTFLQRHRDAQSSAVTIAPDRRGIGTNLLAWRPLGQFQTQYGADSFAQHCAQARALSAQLSICELPGARCDIDEPDDLLLMLAQSHQESVAHNTISFLHESGIAERLHTMQLGEHVNTEVLRERG